MTDRDDVECKNCGHLYLVQENVFQHDCKNPKKTIPEDAGFTGSFQTRMAWLFHESTRHLLSSEGWRVFDEGVDITHAEIEDAVDMDELARVFEDWLDDQLNAIQKKGEGK